MPGTKFHPNFPDQDPNSVWCYGTGAFAQGSMPPFLIKGRYGEPILTRIYNNTPIDREDHGPTFGRNESQLHFHNAHNGAESDGATGAHHFPGTFYDYLLEHDAWPGATRSISTATDRGPPDRTATAASSTFPATSREFQGTMWTHDHRFFFTAENVYKGNLSMINYYSGPDRGNEQLADGVNLRLPSGKFLDYGNVDFDVNLILSDAATEPGRPAILRHLHHRRVPGRRAARQLRLCAVLRGAAAQVPLPHPGRRHVALLQACARAPTTRRCRSSSSPTTATSW